MAHVSYSELQADLNTWMDKVCDGRAPLLVRCQNARSVVMMSEEEYESLMETVHLLTSPGNAARLFESIDQANRGDLFEVELIERL